MVGAGRGITGRTARGATRAVPLALAILAGAPLAPPPFSATHAARAADLAVDAGHALVVHAPSPMDPRYARMRMEFAAIEMVWRDAGVTFVGLFPAHDPETMGLMPDGLGVAGLRRTAPAAGGFGVRLVRANGRLVHASDGEVHRAVLLGLAMEDGRSRGVASASPPLTAPAPSVPGESPAVTPDPVVAATVPVPIMRPRPTAGPSTVGSTARAVPVPQSIAPAVTVLPPSVAAGPTMLDWGAPPAVTVPSVTAGASSAATIEAPDRTIPAAEPATSAAFGPRSAPEGDRAVPDPALPPPDAGRIASAPIASAPADPWGLWTGAPDGSDRRQRRTPATTPGATVPSVPDGPRAVRVVGTAAPSRATAVQPAIAPVVVPAIAPPFDPLPAALPPETIARVREALVAERLEAAEDNGFDDVELGAALPMNVQARMRFAGGVSLSGPDLGFALLVTRSCGAAQPPRATAGRWRWFGN